MSSEKDKSEYRQDFLNIAHQLRIRSVEATNACKSGHPTSCSSIAEIMAVLFFDVMRYDVKNPLHRSSDRFILSKGHAAPILYAAWAEAGLFPVEDLLQLRNINSDLEGHPTPRLNFIDVGTGSLGQGLSIGCGMAYVGKYYDNASYRVYVLLGDGESTEGSVWEAFNFASVYKLDNLCIIFDINRLGQSEATCLQYDFKTYKARLEAFGLKTFIVDGHDPVDLAENFKAAKEVKDLPTAILAKTQKGYAFPNIADKENWHGKSLHSESTLIPHLKSLLTNPGRPRPHHESILDDAPTVDISNIRLYSAPSYKEGDLVATRLAYGNALISLAKSSDRVIALDGDTKNSTYSEKIKTVNPAQHIECYIAEQNLVGVGMGITCRNRTVAFVSTFAAFLTRAFDQIRMGAISYSNINFVGSHCGVSIGEDGPSQMGLEDIAMFRTIPGATVFYPSDAVSCEMSVELAANTKGICYIRTSRPNTPVIYSAKQKFEIGKAIIVKRSATDKVLVIGAGVTLHESLKAYKILLKMNIFIRVLDPFTIKPLDAAAIEKNALECEGHILVVEDHYPEGGIGEAVASSVRSKNISIKFLAVREVPRSGVSEALLEKYAINSDAIVKAVLSFE